MALELDTLWYLCDTCTYKIGDIGETFCACRLKGDEVFKVITNGKVPNRERCHFYAPRKDG